MGWIVYHRQFPRQDRRWFSTSAGAKRSATCSNRHNQRDLPYSVMEESLFDLAFPQTMKTVRSLMTGELVEIPEDTPWCLNPASETYWSR